MHWFLTGQIVNKEYYVEVLRGFWKRFRRKRPALLKSGKWHFHQDNAPVHNSILVTDYLTKMGIRTVSHPPYSRDLAPCDFWLFPKLRGCRDETIEEIKEAVRKVIDTLTQEDFHEDGLPEVAGTVQQVYCSRRRLLRRGLEFHVCTINKSAHTKKVWKLIVYSLYQDLAREQKKTMEHKSDCDTNCNYCYWYSHQRIGTRTRGLGNKRTSGDHSDYSMVEIGQNTQKRLEETCCHSSEKTISKRWCEKLSKDLNK